VAGDDGDPGGGPGASARQLVVATVFTVSATVFAAGVYAYLTPRGDDQDVFGEPFVRDSDKAPAQKEA
jgi:hypothetical protein